jgi:hypothetical protein
MIIDSKDGIEGIKAGIKVPREGGSIEWGRGRF